MKKILLFLIAGAFFLSSAGWCREGDCDDAKIVYLSAFEVDPNLLIILDNSASMNIIAQPTVENGYTCTTGIEEEYIYDSSKTYSTPFTKELQVTSDGWKVIGERSPGVWIFAYFVNNDHSGNYGGIYEANYLNWLLKKAHLETVAFADYGTDKFYRIELKRVNAGYIKGIPRFVRDLTDEEGLAFLQTQNQATPNRTWLDFYLSDDTIQGEPWYNYWYDKPASRMNVARYALCELLRTDLKKIDPAWEFKFCYGLMTFRNYHDDKQLIYWPPWATAEGTDTSQWVARGGELLVPNGTLTKTHLDDLQSHIATIEAMWLTQLGEAVYEAGAYYTGTDTYFCVARGTGEPPVTPPPTQRKIIKGTGTTYVSPIQWWCQDSNILLITDGYPTHDTEVPPLKKLGSLVVNQEFNATSDYVFFDYDGDGKEPPLYQERNPEASGEKWNTSGIGCFGLMGGSNDSWCSHYLDDVVEYYYKTDAVSWDPYSQLQRINTYIVGFGYDSPFLKEAAEDTYPDGSYKSTNYLGLKENQHRYFTATSKKKLAKGLMSIIQDIIDRMSSSVAVAVSLSTSQSQAEDRIVRAKFDPVGWKGYFQAYEVPYCAGKNAIKPPETSCTQPYKWEAGERLGTETKEHKDNESWSWRDLGGSAEENRNMYTSVGGGGDKLKFIPTIDTNFNALKNLLRGTSTEEQLPDDYIKTIMCWTRGEYWVDSTNTSTGFNPGNNVFLPDKYSWLQPRDKGWRLFEIVYSTPVVAGAPNAWYGTTSYTKDFAGREDMKKRKRVAYVGDNGGSLHCFKLINDEEYCDKCEKKPMPDKVDRPFCEGWENWAYIPSNLLGQLQYKAEKNHCRFSMVDLGSVKYDVLFPDSSGYDYFNDGMSQTNNWRTILIGGERAGGSQWFCLNITQPDCMTYPNTKTVLWEYSNREMLGDSYSYPEGGRIKDASGEKWLAFLTTGPQATSTLPYIIPLDITNGTPYGTPIIVKDSLTSEYATSPLTSCSALDFATKESGGRGFDDVIDVLYFGDAGGNLWKMKVGSTTNPLHPCWEPRIFFRAKDSNDKPQPIVVSISIAFNNDYYPTLFFGSGRYLTKSDAVSTQTQSFYAVIDKKPWELPKVASDILERSNLDEIGFIDHGAPECVAGDKGNTFIPYGTRSTYVKVTVVDPKGWFLDFTYVGCDGQTERAPEPALVYGGIVFFTSVVPNTQPCEAGGYGYIHAMGYLTGKIEEEIIIGAEMMTSIFLGKGAPSRPIIDVGSKQLLVQMSEGDVLKTVFIKTPSQEAQVMNWGEEGIIKCHICEKNITHLTY
ncbi:MAG: PilC/PilY family type IV pilus protein [bacterium]